jgi:hypothetical protein
MLPQLCGLEKLNLKCYIFIMSKNKTPRLGAKDQAFIDDVDRHIAAGLSVHVIAQKFHLPVESTAKLIAERTEAIKNSAGNQRIILRQLFRDSVPKAISKLNTLMDYKTDGGIDRDSAVIQVKAASEILKHAIKFVDEDVLTAWIERPSFQEQKQKVFEYTAQIDDSGSVVLSADIVE